MDSIIRMIELETQAADFYIAYAGILKDESISKVFGKFAGNAGEHVGMLRELIGKKEIPEAAEDGFGSSLFKCLEGCGCIRLRAEELAAYVACSDMERKLLADYGELRTGIKDTKVSGIMKHIGNDHKEALFMLTDMIEFLNRSSDWVESAEFTLREPY